MKNTTGPFSIIKKSFLWIIVGACLCISSIFVFILNFRPSIEFTGGIQMNIQNIIKPNEVEKSISTDLNAQGFQDIQVNVEQQNDLTTLLVSLPFKDDNEVKKVSDSVSAILLSKGHITQESDIVGSSLNGPSISEYMKSSTLSALMRGIILIAIYIMVAFAPMRKHISPLTLAIVTIATMIFDVSLPAGAYGIWMMIDHSVTVDTIFVIALLTTMGYSINDTIIILDRIRENTVKYKDGLENGSVLYSNMFESSLRQTMRRSLGTGLATFLAIVSMYIFGESVMQSFAFTMGVGIIAGSYSSIFVGAPLTYLLLGKRKKEFKKMT